MAETAAHLVDHVLPPVAMRQWVLSVPKRLRWHLHHQPGALDTALRILLDPIERHLGTDCEAAATNARGGAVAFIHRFGSALNAHTHFHVCSMDGVFEPDGERVRFHAAPAPGPDDIEVVQAAARQRVLRAFQRRGWLERTDRHEMEHWHYGGGFSLDASVGIASGDRCGRGRLLRYCARRRLRPNAWNGLTPTACSMACPGRPGRSLGDNRVSARSRHPDADGARPANGA